MIDMNSDLLKAREELKNKLIHNAQKVIDEVFTKELENLIEIGLFGSLVQGNFTCLSDADVYLIFDGDIPERTIKGELRSIAEENNCDIVFISNVDFLKDSPSLLVMNIKKHQQIIWRRNTND